MWRALAIALLAASCQPKQPLQASYFNAEKAKQGPATCGDTLACYGKCEPMTEECMLLCDQKGHPKRVELARAVTYCSAQHGCTADDRSCIDAKCATEIQACTAPPVVAAPTQMRPQPYPGQAGGPSPTQPQPYPGQAGAMQPPPPMQPQPYPGQPASGPPPPPGYRPPPPPTGYRAPPPMQPYQPAYRPPPPMQPQPYPGQQGYRPPPRSR